MANEIRIVTDSGCDLDAEVLEEYQIEVVPLTVLFGTQAYTDGKLSREEFWQKMAGPEQAGTSQPPLGVFEEVFQRLVDQGKQVLYVGLTSKHSGTLSTAQLAARRFGSAVQVFDSLSLSLGQGMQALAAAQAARAGGSMGEILAALEGLRDRMSLQIVLDTLENLRKGGRADAFISVAERMTRALNIKVIVNVVEGQLRLMSAARSFKRALGRVLDSAERLGPLGYLAVIHSRAAELAEEVADELARRTGYAREQISVCETGVVLSVHAGPGVIGVLAIPES
jgi:DegV family protein with EDD domain